MRLDHPVGQRETSCGWLAAADLDAAELAALLIEAWEGAALRGKVTRSRTPYERFEAVTVPALLH